VTLPTDGEPQPHLVGGRYLDQHQYESGEWRMQHRHYVLDWIRQFDGVVGAASQDTFSLTAGCPRGAHYLQDSGNALLIAHASNNSNKTEALDMNASQALDDVISHQAIIELGCRCARGVDRGDPEMIMTAFHDDAEIVSGAFNGSAVAFSTEIGKLLDEISPSGAYGNQPLD